jgi:type IV secretory pathway TraG/TraD family ATPase VirD4
MWLRKRRAITLAVLPYAVSLTVALAGAVALGSILLAVLAAGVTAGVAGVRAHEHLGWHRAGGKAAMRKRRRYQGTATRTEIQRKLSPEAAAKKAGPPVLIGRAMGQDIAGSSEESYLLIAPPRSFKTGLTSCWALDAPGAFLGYSSRCDQARHTMIPRSRRGDVLVLNADGDGGIPTSFAWSPVEGCQNPQTAIRRAGDLMHASPRDSSGKDAWHEDRGARLIRCMLHAAAADGASMHEVTAWVHDPLSAEPMSILASPRAWPGWDAKLAGLLEGGREADALAGLIGSASAALGWMDDPMMAAAACPRPGDGVNLREFIEGATGSIYMIGADRPHGSLAPYFAAFGSEAFETAKSVAEDQGGRLEVPFTILADEAAVICPLPFHKMTAVAGGYRMVVVACVQADSQLVSRWGEYHAKTMKTNFTVKIIGGGFTDPAELEAMSVMCGDRDTWDHAKNADGSRTRTPRQERLFPPERIRMLPPWHALVLHRSTRPVEVTVTPVWDRRGYEAAAPGTFAAEPEPLAIEAPRRQAIPMAPVRALDGPENVTPVPHYAPEEAVQWQPATRG